MNITSWDAAVIIAVLATLLSVCMAFLDQPAISLILSANALPILGVDMYWQLTRKGVE